MENKKPTIRFKEYIEDWNEYKLCELVTPIVREVPKPEKPYKRLSIRSHAKGTFQQIVSDPNKVAMDRLYIVKENDLIVNITFAWEHAIAIAEKKDDGLLVSHRFPTFLIDKSDINFIRYTVGLEKFRREMELISPGGAGRNKVLNKKDFINLKVNAPNQIEEQTKIGEFFKQLDETISLHEQELAALKQTKQGFLQKMLPKEGESVPEFRFTGFTGEWEQLKLDELAEKVSVGIATSSSEYFTNNTEGVPFIKNKNIKNNRIDDSELEYISKDFDQANVTKRIKTGDILTVRTGYPGLSAVVPSHLNNAQTFTTLITRLKDDKALPEFVSTFINSNAGIKQITGMEAGGAQKNVNAGVLKNLVISLPSFNEQVIISEFFSCFDEVITLHQQELEALKQTKQAFLQKMFV